MVKSTAINNTDGTGARASQCFRDLMQAHHYLGAVPGMGENGALCRAPSGTLAGASGVLGAGAEVRRARPLDRPGTAASSSAVFIWSPTTRRFLILPGGGERNLGSRVLSLCTRRLVRDWPARFGHDVLLAETFVDPRALPGHRLPRAPTRSRSGAPAASPSPEPCAIWPETPGASSTSSK